MKRSAQILLLTALLIGMLPLVSPCQAINDGPITLMARVRQFNPTFNQTDLTFFGVQSAPDDLSLNLWGRDFPALDSITTNGGWGSGAYCLTDTYSVAPTKDFNDTFYIYTYASAPSPSALEIRADFWEDESPDQLLGSPCAGTRCNYDLNFCCGGFLFGTCLGAFDSDDLRCNSDANPGNAPYATLNYRLGAPGTWYSHGPVGGTCGNNVFFPVIETYWAYTGGENCSAPIALGSVQPGFSPITHSNSADNYTDDYPTPGGGRDLVYEFSVAIPLSLQISTCGAGTGSTDIYLLDLNCQPIQTSLATCGNGSSFLFRTCVPGTYRILVEARNNGTGTFTLNLTEYTGSLAPLIADAGPDHTICPGGIATLGGTPAQAGGFGPYNTVWSPAAGLSNTLIPNPFASVTTATPYILQVADQGGCTDADTAWVYVHATTGPNLGQDTFLCPGQTITLQSAPAAAYAWSTAATSSSIPVSVPGTYAVTITDANACSTSDTILVSASTSAAPQLGQDTILCRDTSVVLSPGAGFAGYSWNGGSTNPAIVVTTGGTYAVTVTTTDGCLLADTIMITGLADCVFPGDANYDLVCDALDVLSIGLMQALSGPSRPGATLAWYGQDAANFATSTLSANDKHGDTDGDGTVSPGDTLAVHSNWAASHTRITAGGGDYTLSLVAQQDTILAGGLALFDLILSGSGGQAADSVHGLGFTVTWPQPGMAPNALRTADFSPCWFTSTGNHLDFTRMAPNSGTFAVSRMDRQPANGQGLVAHLHFLTDPALAAGQYISFRPGLQAVNVMQPDGSISTATIVSDSVVIAPLISANITPMIWSLPYPLPADDILRWQLPELGPCKVTLHDTQGRAQGEWQLPSGAFIELPTAHLPGGTYWLRVAYAGGTLAQPVVIAHGGR